MLYIRKNHTSIDFKKPLNASQFLCTLIEALYRKKLLLWNYVQGLSWLESLEHFKSPQAFIASPDPAHF